MLASHTLVDTHTHTLSLSLDLSTSLSTSLDLSPVQIVTVGMSHIKFWVQKGNSFTSKRGIFGKLGKVETMLCLTFGSDGKTYTGSASGKICVWEENQLVRVVNAQKGPMFAIHALEQAFLTGGKDSVVRIWGPDLKKPLHEFALTQAKVVNGAQLTNTTPAIRALEAENGMMFAGTSTGEVLQFDDRGNITVISQVCVGV